MSIDNQQSPSSEQLGNLSTTKLIELSRTCARQGRLDEALRLAEAAHASAPFGKLDAATHLGWTLDRIGEHGRAQAIYLDALSREPGNRPIQILLSDSLIAQRRFAQALQVLESLYTEFNGSAAAVHLGRRIVFCHLGLANLDAAKAALQPLLERHPGDFGLLDLYRRIACDERRPLDAAEAFLNGAQSHDDRTAHIAIAIDLLIQASQLERAISAGEHALASGQRSDRILRLLIDAYQIAGRHSDALRIARLALEASPDSEHYWRIVLRYAVQFDDLESAVESALRALKGKRPVMRAEISWIIERLRPNRERVQDFVRRLVQLRPLEPWFALLGPRAGLRLDERFSRRSVEEQSIEIAGADSCWAYMSDALDGLQHRGYEGERSRSPERPVKLIYVRHVRLCVLPNGFFIFVRNGDPLEHFAPYLHDAMIDHALSMTPNGSIERLFFIGDKHAPNNYAHWTLDYLPRAAVAESFAPDFLIGVPYLPDSSFHRDTFHEIRIDPFKCIALASGIYEVDHLMFLSASSQDFCHSFHGGNRYYASIMLRRLTSAASEQGTRIFLDRAPGTTRQIVNRREVVPLLEEFGVRVVDPGTLPLRQQISLMQKADLVIGPHGAGLANVAYCKPGTRVLELWHPLLGNPAFVKAAFVAGARYDYLQTAQAPVEAAGNASPILANYEVDCTALREWLESSTG